MNLNQTDKKRYNYIDVIRGVAIIGMLVHHFLYDLDMLGFIDGGVLDNDGVSAFLKFGAGVFIFISGVCTSFSSNNYKRGIIILAVAYAFQAFTYFFMNDSYIAFGILHLLGWCNILAEPLKKVLSKTGHKLIAVCVLIGVTLAVGYGIDAVNPIDCSWLYALGLYDYSFYSADYFPLLPWIFVFMSGIVFGIFQVEHGPIAWLEKIKCAPIEFIGRNTLWIYILHQPVFYLVLYVIKGLC